MDFDCLKGLEPAAFFHWFGQICKIPHGSQKEEKLAAYLQEFARERGFFSEIDDMNNVLMRIPATAGRKDRPPLLMQAHLDMVWRSEEPFDFETQPIPLQVTGNRLTAKGTTLGADNAVGIATMLALADGNDPHPELELLFTTAEEVGMLGVRGFDCTKLKARRMINMDCGDSHVICVTSAGSVVGQVEQKYAMQPIPAGWQVYHLNLLGGLGGHSGIDANKGRGCGGNLLGDLLLGMDWMLCSASGQDAIIKASQAVIAASGDITAQLQDRFADLKRVYQDTDPNWQLQICSATANMGLSVEDSANVVLALSTLRTGQFRADGNLPGVVITSGQLRSFLLKEGELHIAFSVRSACDSDQELLFARYQAILARFGLRLQHLQSTSGWQERQNSQLRQQFMQMHKKQFGCEMEVERVHGGVEVGILVGKIPDMDAIGIAPTARGAHTTGEYLLIDQVQPYWQLLTAVIAEL